MSDFSLTGRLRAERQPSGATNGFGAACLGLAGGFVLSAFAIGIYLNAEHNPKHPDNYAETLIGLVALWVGLVAAALFASSAKRDSRRLDGDSGLIVSSETVTRWRSLGDRYGFRFRAWPDIPIGIVVGLVGQYLLVPVAELPLLPFVPHLYSRLNEPAKHITGGSSGLRLAVLGVFLCLGSPIIEELFFRGLLLRSLEATFSKAFARFGPSLAIVVSGVLFGLVHFEALQFIGLATFGVVLGCLAQFSRRLGPGIVAHMTFNAVTIIAIATSH